MGDFVALQSFGSEASGDDESTVQTQTAEIRQKKRAEIKRNMLPIVGTPGKYKDIEATQSTDSAVYNDGSCGVCVSNLFGWHPKTVVIKVAVSNHGMPPLSMHVLYTKSNPYILICRCTCTGYRQTSSHQ